MCANNGIDLVFVNVCVSLSVVMIVVPFMVLNVFYYEHDVVF